MQNITGINIQEHDQSKRIVKIVEKINLINVLVYLIMFPVIIYLIIILKSLNLKPLQKHTILRKIKVYTQINYLYVIQIG